MKPSLLLYPHGGSGNHGCEAIVRSTAKITKADIELCSDNLLEDRAYGLDAVCHLHAARQPIEKMSLGYVRALVKHCLGDKYAYDRLLFSPIVGIAGKCDYALSIGGDNYCYGEPVYLYLVNGMLRRQGKKTLLWGCSIEPDVLRGELLADVGNFSYIFARESITYNALKEAGIKQVSLFPDPAFALEYDKPQQQTNVVGINISPMIMGYEKQKGAAFECYKVLIQYILEQTDMNISLIPHVVWTGNDDRIPLKKLYDTFRNSGRVSLLNDADAESLKAHIAQCRFVVAARTHASIAAYSTKVPTLVVGYSVKAKGIALDLFGTYQSYVIPVQALRSETDLLEPFLWMMKNEDKIRNHYDRIMPSYLKQAEEAGEILKSL